MAAAGAVLLHEWPAYAIEDEVHVVRLYGCAEDLAVKAVGWVAALDGDAAPRQWAVDLTALRGPRALAEDDCRREAETLGYLYDEDEEEGDELPAGVSVASAWWSSDEGGMGMTCDGRDWIRDLGDGRWRVGSSGDSGWRTPQTVPRPATDEAAADLILDLLGSNDRYSGAAAWALEPLDPSGTLSPQRRKDLKSHVWQEPPAGVALHAPDAVLQIVRRRLRESDYAYARARKALEAPADPESYNYFDSCNPFDGDLPSRWRAGDPHEKPEILARAFESGERDLWERLRTNPAFGPDLIDDTTSRDEGVFTYLLEDPSTSDQTLADWPTTRPTARPWSCSPATASLPPSASASPSTPTATPGTCSPSSWNPTTSTKTTTARTSTTTSRGTCPEYGARRRARHSAAPKRRNGTLRAAAQPRRRPRASVRRMRRV